MKALQWFIVLAIAMGASSCGLRGKLKTPSQIEAAEAKKEGRSVKNTNAASATATQQPPATQPPSSAAIIPAARNGILTPTTGTPIFLPPATPPPEQNPGDE